MDLFDQLWIPIVETNSKASQVSLRYPEDVQILN